jgi:hypothetical protein
LFVIVATSDPEVRQQLATGLVIWLDPTSKKAQESGLRIPGTVRRFLPGAQPDSLGADSTGGGSVARLLDQFDWLGPGKNQRRLVSLTPDLGIAIASGTEEGVLAYEVRLPLGPSPEHPYAVGATPGSSLMLGLETPSEPPVREGRGPGGAFGGSGGPGGGIGSRGGGMGGSGGGMPPRGVGRGGAPGAAPVKAMKLIWIRIALARPIGLQ